MHIGNPLISTVHLFPITCTPALALTDPLAIADYNLELLGALKTRDVNTWQPADMTEEKIVSALYTGGTESRSNPLCNK